MLILTMNSKQGSQRAACALDQVKRTWQIHHGDRDRHRGAALQRGERSTDLQRSLPANSWDEAGMSPREEQHFRNQLHYLEAQAAALDSAQTTSKSHREIHLPK